MKVWFARNARPIGIVVLASAVVVVLFEVLDAATASGPAVSEGSEGPELEGIAVIAGLIKVSLLMGVGSLFALPLRRRFSRAAHSAREEALDAGV